MQLFSPLLNSGLLEPALNLDAKTLDVSPLAAVPLDAKHLEVSPQVDQNKKGIENFSEVNNSLRVEVGSQFSDAPLFGDYWEWVTPDFLRRTHVQSCESLFPTSSTDVTCESNDLEPVAVHIRDSSLSSPKSDHGVHVLIFDWQKQAPLTFPFSWKGETWFMQKGQTKRSLFAIILKHSQTRIVPRLLRTAWKHSCFNLSHGFLSTNGESPLKCAMCWAHPDQPPRLHSKEVGVPKTKDELMHAMGSMEKCPFSKSQMKEMRVPELKHHFKELTMRAPHPCCPVTRLSMLRRDELKASCIQHGMTPGEGCKKGELQSMLRMHWEEQCELANHLQTTKKMGYAGGSEVPKATAVKAKAAPKSAVQIPVPKSPPGLSKNKRTNEAEDDHWDLVQDVQPIPEVLKAIQVREMQAALMRREYGIHPTQSLQELIDKKEEAK